MIVRDDVTADTYVLLPITDEALRGLRRPSGPMRPIWNSISVIPIPASPSWSSRARGLASMTPLPVSPATSVAGRWSGVAMGHCMSL
jgi:hypothetical protein